MRFGQPGQEYGPFSAARMFTAFFRAKGNIRGASRRISRAFLRRYLLLVREGR